jgi:ABC-type branched-subunit amino acid transport system ATPase component
VAGSGRGSPALAVNRDVSFEVGHGEVFGFLGPNGAAALTACLAVLGAEAAYQPVKRRADGKVGGNLHGVPARYEVGTIAGEGEQVVAFEAPRGRWPRVGARSWR